MTIIASPLATGQGSIPITASTQLGKFPGLRMHFPTLAAFQTAVTVEQTNVAGSNALWADQQPMSVASEPTDVYRVWSVSGNHARGVIVRPGLLVVLAGDTNTVLTTSGAPNNGTGSNGDIAIDYVGNVVYAKSGGAWASSVAQIYPAPIVTSGTKTSLTVPSSDGDYSGVTVKVANAAASLTKWQAVGVNSSGLVALASATGIMSLGLLVADVASGAQAEFLIQGLARKDGWAWTPGQPIWLSGTAGALTQIEPTATGAVSEPIGWAITPTVILVNVGQAFNFTGS